MFPMIAYQIVPQPIYNNISINFEFATERVEMQVSLYFSLREKIDQNYGTTFFFKILLVLFMLVFHYKEIVVLNFY